jgi:plastocyanin domain-containing protein
MINAADILVIVAAAAVLAGGIQRLEVTVKGGYRPEVIRVR